MITINSFFFTQGKPLWVGLRRDETNHEYQWEDGTLFRDTEIGNERQIRIRYFGNYIALYNNEFYDFSEDHINYRLCQKTLLGFTPNETIENLWL